MADFKTLQQDSGVLSSLLRNELWKAYSDGGELEWIKNAALLAKIADAYYSIRSVMSLSDRYYDSTQYSTEQASPARIREVINTLRETLEHGSKSIKNTLKAIDVELNSK